MPRTLLIVAAASLMIALAPAPTTRAADGPHRPVVAGNLVVNAKDVVAVFRPLDQQAVAVFVGRPGQAVQAIVFQDVREAAAVFTEFWNNQDVVKDPGETDARPLTRMMVKTPEKRGAALIVNFDRLVACAWDTNRRSLRIFLDKPIATALPDPNSGVERDYLELHNNNGEADIVMAAMKACAYNK